MPTASSPLSHSADPPKREDFVHRLFDRISPGYDRFNRVASLGLDRGWRRRAVAALKLTPGMRVLDLATGTGDLALETTRPLIPLGQVVACDLSFPMLRLAQRKFTRSSYAHWHIVTTQARAEQLPFQDESFHAVTIGFALRNVSDLPQVFRELYRILQPGGRIALLEFGRPQGFLTRIGHRIWLSTWIPFLGFLTTGRWWPFLYLRRSILAFMLPSDLLHHLKEAGFTEAVSQPLNGGIVQLYQALRPGDQ